jgi:putative oxidoreductase
MSFQIADLLLMVGRVLLGGLFVLGGVHHFFQLDFLTKMMTARGVPLAKLTLIVGSVFQAIAGLLLMLGLYVAPAALGLVVFTVIASVMFLNYWDMQGEPREAMKNVWKSNIAIIGGLFVAAAQAM